MIEFDIDMSYLLECDELDKVVLNDENGEHEPMEFVPADATVGAGTLTAEQVRECVKGVYFEGYSDGVTHRVNGIEETDWQAIADKLNATLGAGTCKDVCASNSEFTCSECGFNCDLMSWISLFDGDDGRHRHHHHGTPNYCPNCGARIEMSE